ncbi:hypothetical protein TSOC_003733 [Tetrabaena socialis]|uniref:Uncharacterized protein n=1 Tax=Tetrabaena socialis TaxID=47790 RepID=A0A2J8AAS9_9CHLO|nr:hypothetical protein TSOC_003733 [Tetrabaena socialis]|eukprot:PNH09625.1 hypothetical protein TSOC_003733 [Tetrabaena socialis]
MQSTGRGLATGQAGPCCSRPVVRLPQLYRHQRRLHSALPLPHPPAASAAFGASPSGDSQPHSPPAEDFKPFQRLKERDPYKLLGLSREAAFEEVQDARNYLYDLYRWHEPSREAIELAFDTVIKEKLSSRHKFGFQPIRMGRRGDVMAAARAGWNKKIYDLFDPTITFRTLINEGSVFALLALW